MNEPQANEPVTDGVTGGPVTDGRRAKGERRRRALIEATLRVIERDGAAGVTHRTVAREAELPTTATTYYFESVEALLTAALTSAMETDAERVRQLTAAPVDGPGGAGARGDKRRMLARLMAGTLEDRGLLLAEFELCLLAARRPELRSRTDRWFEALAGFARLYTQDPLRIKLFTRAYDGLLLQALLAEEPPAAEEFEAMLWELLPDAG
ncbi:TetR family transcriptional regulator [Streptomyces sp. CB02923]|uniref:TetR/AcrR family transcriptional regulator n=1 Tax=Streptomyces sp. CB02923 TaxID=1718985 RepID=UPI0009390216|nr:TetR family transcriptional regulator [Streptomyces sp. CB02923]OKH97793.1 TetR family transcriptional regulator [Streptomyces sp. CB02923]